MIRDAGGSLWKNEAGRGSLSLDFEEVLAEAREADKWILTDNDIKTRRDLTNRDPRYVFFKAFTEGQVYNNNRRVGVKGNDYWETGVMEPQEILADFIQICHGAETLDREMKYLVKVE